MKNSKEEIGHQIIVSIIDDQIKADDIDIHLCRNSFSSSIPSMISGVDLLLSCTLQIQVIAMFFFVIFPPLLPNRREVNRLSVQYWGHYL